MNELVPHIVAELRLYPSEPSRSAVARGTATAWGWEIMTRAVMTETEAKNLSVVRSYIAAVEGGATGDALAGFFVPEAIQVELPNRLNPQGGQSDLATILARADQGKKLLKSQVFEVKSETVQGSRVAIEAVWTGVLAMPLGALAADATLRAHFAMFFDLTDGRIRAQRNYDCFEPW